MDKNELESLLQRYLDGACSSEERRQVEAWYNRTRFAEHAISEEEIDEDVRAIRNRLRRQVTKQRTIWVRYAAAVVLVLGIGGALYWTGVYELIPNRREMVATVADIPPGGNKATLTLADGRTIELNNSQKGIVLGQEITYTDGTNVLAPHGAAIASDGGQSEPSDILNLVTLTTPKGGQYQIMLPDGTSVWLNAASSLQYSPHAVAGERVVRLDGEAYFEVARDEKSPFKVITAGQVIEVLGTHFNVSSYADDPTVKTALVAGQVRVVDQATQEEAILKPGEYAVSAGNAPMQVVKGDVSNAIAWKNGLFRFDNTDIETIMRQLSRWYDVEVVFEGTKPDIILWGEVYRQVDATQALEILTFFDLNYRIEKEKGMQRIVIYP